MTLYFGGKRPIHTQIKLLGINLQIPDRNDSVYLRDLNLLMSQYLI